MGSFEVDPTALEDASSELSAAAAGLRDADVAGPFGGVGDALPGSRTSIAAVWVSTRLGAAVQVYADRLDDMAGVAADTAASYRCVDQTVAERLGGVTRP